MNRESSFTLIELLIVIGVLAVLATIAVLALNPQELIKQARDSQRMADLATINKALAVYQSSGQTNLGTANTVYISIPSNQVNCSNLGLPSLPSGWTYACVVSSTLRNINGSGWIPLSFSSVSYGTPLEKLPVDPVNTTSTQNYYTYTPGGSWELTSLLESQKYLPRAINDGDSYPGVYSIKTSSAPLTPGIRDYGLVGYWTFDEGTGITAYDSSGNGRNGTLTNNPQWITGKVNGGLYYNTDGTTKQYVQLPSFPLLGGPITISLWAKSYQNTSYIQTLIGGSDQSSSGIGYIWMYRGQSADSLNWQYAQSGTYSAPGINGYFTGFDGIWIFITIVSDYTNNQLYFYRNGSLIYSTAMTGSIAPSVNRVRLLGTYSSASHPAVNTQIDDFRIYNRALSAAEVMAIYSATK